MVFDNLPEGVAAAGIDVIPTIKECDPDRITEVHILKVGETVGVKRFRGEQLYDINVSCYLNNTLDIEPYYGVNAIGYNEMGSWMGKFSLRATQYDISDDGPPENSVWIETAELPYTAGTYECLPMRLLTEMQGRVEITPDETLCLPVLVNSSTASSLLFINVPDWTGFIELKPRFGTNGKMYCYFINPVYIQRTFGCDFDETADLEIQILDGDTITDSIKIDVVVPPVEGVRLCWVNKYGTVDTFTFSPVLKAAGSANKTRILSGEGYTVTNVQREDTFTVASPFVSPEKLAALSGIFSSPKVWVLEQAGAVKKRIDVITSQSDIEFNSPGSFSLTFRYC